MFASHRASNEFSSSFNCSYWQNEIKVLEWHTTLCYVIPTCNFRVWEKVFFGVAGEKMVVEVGGAVGNCGYFPSPQKYKKLT